MHLEQRSDDAARGAAGTEYQNIGAFDSDAKIDSEVAQQAYAVGVVAVDFTAFEGQRIDRSRGCGAFTQCNRRVDKLRICGEQ